QVQAYSAGEDARDLQKVADELGEVADLSFDDLTRLLLNWILATAWGLRAQEWDCRTNGRQRVAQFVAEHGEEFVLAPVFIGQRTVLVAQTALPDAAYIALRHQTAVFAVHVAHELDGNRFTRGAVQRQMIVLNVTFTAQLSECGLVFPDVLEEADLPEFLADEVTALEPDQLGDIGIGVGDLAIVGIEDEDAVLGGLEQFSVADFGSAHLPLGDSALGHIFDSQKESALRPP